MAERYSYPLSNEADYKGRIIFQMVNEEAERAAVADLTQNFNHLLDAAGDALGTIGDVGTYLVKEGASGLWSQFKAKLGIGQNALRQIANERQSQILRDFKGAPRNDIVRTKELTVTDDKVTLYLPQAVQVADAVTYDNNVQLGMIGGGLEKGLLQGGNLNTVIAEKSATVRGQVNSFLNDPNINIPREQASLLSSKIVGKAGGQYSDAVKAATGVQTNPNVRALFREVPLRNFSFTFTLIPTSEAEAEEIENIIRFFRTEIYPEALSVGGIDYGYKFPRRFVIRVVYDNKQIPGVKFLPAYLQNFTATYNPNGMGMHRNGRFSEYQITMNFSEAKALSKQDIRDGY